MTVYDALLFDLDGTLTDPKPGITRGVQYALGKLGIVASGLDQLTPFIGPPLSESFQRFYGLSAAEADQAILYYRDYFAPIGLYENAVYAGIPELLARLCDDGKRLVLATAKPTVFAERILSHFALDRYFTRVVGANLDETRTTKAEVIAEALSGLDGIPRERIVMIGDREHDITGARRNGIGCIAVAYGYGSLDELRAARPLALAQTVEELARLLV